MAQKYPQPKKPWAPRSRLPQCCLNRRGEVKVKYTEKPEKEGYKAYKCRNGGWHLKSKR